MRTRKLIVGAVVLAALLLAGCGGGSSDRNAMETKFEKIDFEFSTLETPNSVYNQPHFQKTTERYIALVHQYEDLLGNDEAKRRLQQEADSLSEYCLSCAGTLEDAASKY
jgi:PBP1b-binding outer membrane lipoprotein LpoB